MRRFTIIAILTSLVTAPSFADTITSRVMSYDKAAKVLVLSDKTIIPLNNPDLVIPDEVAAGVTVTIDYETAGDNGFVKAKKFTVTGG